MSFLSDMTSPMRSRKSGVGFRFHPTDEELVDHYLIGKINGDEEEEEVIPEIKVCNYEPWELPDLIKKDSNDEAWFFFSPCDYKYKGSHRFNRVTKAGFWKPTGKPRRVIKKDTEKVIGTKKSLVFYKKQHPKPIRTSFIMHEYEIANAKSKGKSEFVLYKMKVKWDEKIVDDELDQMPSSPCDYTSPVTINSSCEKSEIMSTTVDFGKQSHLGSYCEDQIQNQMTDNMPNCDFEYQNQDQQNDVMVFRGNPDDHGSQNVYETGSETSESRPTFFEVETSQTFLDHLDALVGSDDSFSSALLFPGSCKDCLSYDYI